MLSVSDSIWAEAGETILKVSADERMRQLIEAREDQRRRQIDAQTLFDKAIKERDDAKKERDDANAKLEATTAELNESKAALKDKDRRIAELEKLLAEKS